MRVFAVTPASMASTSACEIALGCDDGGRAIGLDGDRIDEETMLRIDRFIAGAEIGMREELQ